MYVRQDSSVGISTSYRLDGWGSIPGRVRDFSLLHSLPTSSGANPAPYSIDTGLGG
jgi:hypothetical protein